MKLSPLEQKILMNIQLGIICVGMVGRPGHVLFHEVSCYLPIPKARNSICRVKLCQKIDHKMLARRHWIDHYLAAQI